MKNNSKTKSLLHDTFQPPPYLLGKAHARNTVVEHSKQRRVEKCRKEFVTVNHENRF